MGKVVKLLLAVGLIAIAAYFFMNPPSFDAGSSKNGKPVVKPEEKVGVTTDTVGP